MLSSQQDVAKLSLQGDFQLSWTLYMVKFLKIQQDLQSLTKFLQCDLQCSWTFYRVTCNFSTKWLYTVGSFTLSGCRKVSNYVKYEPGHHSHNSVICVDCWLNISTVGMCICVEMLSCRVKEQCKYGTMHWGTQYWETANKPGSHKYELSAWRIRDSSRSPFHASIILIVKVTCLGRVLAIGIQCGPPNQGGNQQLSDLRENTKVWEWDHFSQSIA